MKAEKRMLAQLKEIDRLDKLSDKLDDEGREEESAKAYSRLWDIAREVATLISKSTFGQITEKTALYMVFHQRDKLIALCKRYA